MNSIFTDAEIWEATARQGLQIEEQLAELRLRERLAQLFSPGGGAARFKSGSAPAFPSNTGLSYNRSSDTNSPVQPAAREILSPQEHNRFPGGRW